MDPTADRPPRVPPGAWATFRPGIPLRCPAIDPTGWVCWRTLDRTFSDTWGRVRSTTFPKTQTEFHRPAGEALYPRTTDVCKRCGVIVEIETTIDPEGFK